MQLLFDVLLYDTTYDEHIDKPRALIIGSVSYRIAPSDYLAE